MARLVSVEVFCKKQERFASLPMRSKSPLQDEPIHRVGVVIQANCGFLRRQEP